LSDGAPDVEVDLELFKDVIRKATEEGASIMSLDSRLRSVDPRELGLTVVECGGSSPGNTYCAVDGSEQLVDVGDAYLVLAKAVVARAEVSGGGVQYSVRKRATVLSDYVGENNVRNHAIRFMLKLETELLRDEFEECDVIFVDGPIVDPPVAVPRSGDAEEGEVPSLQALARLRASVFREILDSGKLVIGIVKRFSERFLLSVASREYPGIGPQLSKAKEKYVAARLMSNVRRAPASPVMLGWISWDERLTPSAEYHEVSNLLRAYEFYREEWGNGISIHSGYYLASASSPPVRVDVPARRGESDWAEHACRAMNRWRLEGKAEAVLLDYLADTYAKVTEGEISSITALYRSGKLRRFIESKDSDAVYYVFLARILGERI
jgi:hypothetical protein